MKKYSFSREIQERLWAFESYLRKQKYAPDTIRQISNYAGVYLEWLEEEGLEEREVKYDEFTTFISYLSGRQVQLKRRSILAVRHYYNYLNLDMNPASGIYIRGGRSSILNRVVPYKILLEAHEHYRTLDDRDRRNKAMLGLMIYQAIGTGVLQRLELRHLRIKEGKIYIPGHGKTNSRTLKLEAVQLLELQEYLEEIRPRMLEHIKAYRPGRKPEQIKAIIRQRLFFSENGSDNIKNSLVHLFRAIKRSYPKITSGKVIRSTVIAHWLETEDIRQVQYKAGHRYVSSTERYNVYNLQELKDSLKKHHPFHF